MIVMSEDTDAAAPDATIAKYQAMTDAELEDRLAIHLELADIARAELDARRLRASDGPTWDLLRVFV
jgi:hypothetical protein